MSNTFTITGNLGADIELRFSPSGVAVANASLAIQNSRKGDDGRFVDDGPPIWVTCSVFGQTAERLAEDTRKGSRVTFYGRLKVNHWNDRDTNEPRKVLVMNVDAARVWPPRDGQQPQQQPQADPWGSEPAQSQQQGFATADDSEPPF